MFFKIKKKLEIKSCYFLFFFFFWFLRTKNIFIFNDVLCILKNSSKNQFSKIEFIL